MHVLVTGSSGRVGGAIAAELATRHTVIGLDARPGPLTTQVLDLRDHAAVAAACAGCEAVIHSAARHAPDVGLVANAEFEAINVAATANLLDACRRHGIERFVYTSSTSVYGHALVPSRAAVWVDETLPPQPRDIYDDTKLAAEALVRRAGLRGAILRMSRSFPEPASQLAQYRLHRGVDLRDVAAAHALALARAPAGTPVYVISAPTPFQREDRAALLHDAAAVIRARAPDFAAAFAARGWPLPASIDRVYDCARAITELGYAPRNDYRALLAELHRA